MIRLASLALLALAPVQSALAQTTAGTRSETVAAIPELDALETRTMRIATSGSADIGSQILGGSPMMQGRTTELTVLDGQITSLLPLYGRSLNWERVGDRRIGTYLVRRTYIVQHERMLTVWYVVYIRLQSGWQVAGLNFNDRLQELNTDW